MKYAICGAVLAIAVCIIPAFWADACVAIAVGAYKAGIISANFAPALGQALLALPWLLLIFSSLGFVIHLAALQDQRT